MKTNLIIGLAYGYDFNRIRNFVHSLYRLEFDGDIVIIGNSKLIIPDQCREKLNIRILHEDAFERSLLKRAFIKLLSVPFFNRPICRILKKRYKENKPAFFRLFKKLYHFQVSRYAVYYEVLKEKKYDNILFTDVRDVVFQFDPFTNFNSNLAAFHESPLITIKDETFNREWIQRGFGQKAFVQLSEKKIYCSGTIMGSYSGMMNFLEIFLLTCVEYAIPFNYKGIDQGIFNYLIHTGKLNGVTKYDNGNIVLTISPDVAGKCSYVTNELKIEGHTPAIVHQYDRFPEINKFFKGVMTHNS
jgi:hypothetical protein